MSDPQTPVPSLGVPSFREFVLSSLKVGCLGFGGPAGQIALMHREWIDKKKWIDEPRYLHALSYCTLLPGPEAQQLATYVGWLLHGVRGGLAAGLLFVLPGAVVVTALADRYANLAKSTRGAIDRGDELGDQDTVDLFTEVSRGLDKSLWFLEAHLQG